MARAAAPKTATPVDEPEELEVVAEDEAPLPEAEPAPVVTVVTASPTTKTVRVKGTWTMYWGASLWDFVDGQRYELPIDLFNYLRQHGNIYDTM